MRDNVTAIAKTIAYITFVLLFLGAGVGTSHAMPDNAIVYVNDANKTYYSVPEVKQRHIKHLRKSTAKEAHSLSYNPDEESRENGDFVEEGRSLTGNLLQYIGLFKPLKSRWNPDGTWNY